MPRLLPSTSSIFLLKPNQQSLALNLALRRPFSSPPTTTSRVALYLRRVRQIDSLRLRVHSHDPSTPFPLPSSPTPLDPFVAHHALRAAPSPLHALSFFRALPSSLHHPHLLLSLAKRLALPGLHSHLLSVLSDLDASPLPPSPMDRLRLLSSAGDITAALQTWSSLRASAASLHHHPPTESYNIVMSLHASEGSHLDAIATFGQLISEGGNPNSRTYTVVIEHLVKSGSLDAALEVFNRLPSMRIRRTTKQYDVLVERLASDGRFVELQRLIGEMGVDGILPGRAVRAAISRLRDAGYTEGTDDFSKELVPNERIGYAVATGEEGAGDEDGEDGSDDDESTGNDQRIRLRPWLDPSALARALDGWDRADVAELKSVGFVWTSRLVCKLLRAFKKPDTAWEFFCWVAYQPGGFAHDKHTVARMIAILARAGHVELVDRLLAKVKSEGILLPFATIRLVIDFYGLSKKADAALRVFRDADSICSPVSQSNRLLLCSSMLRTTLKCKKSDQAMDLLEEMMLEGVLLDLQTFTGMMEYFAGEGDLKRVHKLFGVARQCGIEPDAYLYKVLIQAYCKHERAALALRMFEEMRSSNLEPDGPMKTLLVRSLWKEGKLREAAYVQEMCEEIGEELSAATPGNVWKVSSTDLRRIYDIYSSSFRETSSYEHEARL